jgi:hypothetical protein
MSPDRICAFYSPGPHYVRMLRALRENYPDATLVAAIPVTFPFAIEGFVDETLRLPDPDETRGVKGAYAVLQQIRETKSTWLVVMFDSPRLNLLAAMSAAESRRCYTVDGRFYRLERGVAAIVTTAFARRIRGHWAYLAAWWGTRRR